MYTLKKMKIYKSKGIRSDLIMCRSKPRRPKIYSKNLTELYSNKYRRKMKFSNIRPKETIYINAEYKGKETEVVIRAIDVNYSESSIHVLRLTAREAKEFMELLQIAIEDAERRQEIIEITEEDEE